MVTGDDNDGATAHHVSGAPNAQAAANVGHSGYSVPKLLHKLKNRGANVHSGRRSSDTCRRNGWGRIRHPMVFQ